MRILQVHTRYRHEGGEDRVVEVERQLLRAAGHEVIEVLAHNPPKAIAAARALSQSAWNARAAERVRSIAAARRPDVAHVHNTWFALSAAVLVVLSQMRVPVVLTLHNYRLVCASADLFRDGAPCLDCLGTGPGASLRHRCYRGSLPATAAAAASIAVHQRRGTWLNDVTRYVVPTSFGRDIFLRAGLPPERVDVRPHCVPDAGPRVRPPSRSREVLYVGRLSAEKGVDTLIDAFARSGVAGHLRLVVVGDGPLRAPLERRAGREVTFTGALPQDEVRERMLTARALAFPSLSYESFGLAAAEALAAGLPVLASARGGIPDLVGRGGWLVAAGVVESWSTGLAALVDDEGVDTRGHEARRRWEERYSPSAVLPALESTLRSAVHDGRAARGATAETASVRREVT